MNPVVSAARSNERLAKIAQRGVGRGSNLSFGHHDTKGSPIHVNHLAVTDLILGPAEGMDAEGVAVDHDAAVLDLIMDGNLGEDVLRHWDVTFDLVTGQVWMAPPS